jgi:hypothetical protein
MIERTLDKPRVLPPKGLLLALGSQAPLLAAGMPLSPSAIEIAGGAMFLLAGLVLNVWAERRFDEYARRVPRWLALGAA